MLLANAATIAMLQSEWDGVARMRERMKMLVAGTAGFGALVMAPAVSKVVYNLPLLLAIDVLRQSLWEARDAGLFACRSQNVTPLMIASQASIHWIDWHQMKDAVDRRNEVAHDGKLFDAKQCWDDIDHVERQLRAWGIIA
jgi:hypothetical protein